MAREPVPAFNEMYLPKYVGRSTHLLVGICSIYNLVLKTRHKVLLIYECTKCLALTCNVSTDNVKLRQLNVDK